MVCSFGLNPLSDSDISGVHVTLWLAITCSMPSLLHFLSLFCFSLYLSIYAEAAALTTAIAPNERVCFYADVDKAGEKIGVRAYPIRFMEATKLNILPK